MPKPLRKALPEPTPETQPFWDAAARGELRIQRCVTTGKFFFYPRPCSPYVFDGEVEWVTVSGDATLYSYNINHRPAPGFQDDAPYAIAVVELAEGPRMMTNIVGIENTPENLVLDMPLKVRFQERDGIAVPVFAPAEVAA
ncbi:OB-fold domain-containing protein [Streptomyces sp. NPDC001868]|uniref:Zn-ribbon domain-containing OB-fold protein n=1 Tax=Streptomyces sp. NPDC001868 TaxID=3154401 RepID=UPI0033288181